MHTFGNIYAADFEEKFMLDLITAMGIQDTEKVKKSDFKKDTAILSDERVTKKSFILTDCSTRFI